MAQLEQLLLLMNRTSTKSTSLQYGMNGYITLLEVKRFDLNYKMKGELGTHDGIKTSFIDNCSVIFEENICNIV